MLAQALRAHTGQLSFQHLCQAVPSHLQLQLWGGYRQKYLTPLASEGTGTQMHTYTKLKEIIKYI